MNTKLIWLLGVSCILMIAAYLWTDVRWKNASKSVELVNLFWEKSYVKTAG